MEGRLEMKSEIVKVDSIKEFYTPERCFIYELWNQPEDESMSIAVARVEPGIRTRLHYLEGITERYLIIEGRGLVEVEGLPLTEVSSGDLVVIPEGKRQSVKNIGDIDLKFYCICNPPFDDTYYHDAEKD